MLKQLHRLYFLLPVALMSSATAFSNTPSAPDNSKVLFEILDKYSEVRLGLTETSVYMIFSEDIREMANNDILNQTNINAHLFQDSEGNFVGGNTPLLKSNKIEFSYSEIKNISFSNGKLNFEYYNSSAVGFEDIKSYQGSKALSNFYVEDLESFIVMYQKIG